MKVNFDKTIFAILYTLCGISLTNCYHGSEIVYSDPWIKMHEYEMVDKIQNRKNRKIKNKEEKKTIRPYDVVYDPEEPKAIQDKIVSINVTEETPIVDVIMELARMSGTDIQIDPTIVGGVNLSLKDKPLRYVFNRICGLTDTRYDEKYGIVVFQKDFPYAKTYNIDFLDVSRDTSSSMTLNTSGLSSTNSTSGGQSTVTTKSSDNFWDDVVQDITQIIQTTESTNKIYTTTAERIQRIAKDKEEENKLQEDINNGIYNKNINKNTNNSNKNDASKNENIINNEIIRINKRAGIITITASTKSHRLIKKYLTQLKKKYSSQVLIEMRFLEVNLKKEYESGIDWSKVFKAQNKNASVSFSGNKLIENNKIFNFAWNLGIDTTASLFEEFGSTRTLSNPRINAMNNQPALMTFAKNYVYFKTKSTYTPPTFDTTSAQVVTPGYKNIESESQTMPLGVIMSVLPSIDIDKGEIVLNIKPTISKLEDTVEDPAVSVILTDNTKDKGYDNSEKNKIPVASIRELDTILKLKDGQTAVIGGFTERYGEVTEKGIPVVRSIPLLGNLFESKYNNTKATETIILVKATIVNNGKKLSDYEKNVYDSFSDDPRMNEV